MDYVAYELQAMFDAGLTMVGTDDDGDIEWCGTGAQWREAWKLINNYETFVEDKQAKLAAVII